MIDRIEVTGFGHVDLRSLVGSLKQLASCGSDFLCALRGEASDGSETKMVEWAGTPDGLLSGLNDLENRAMWLVRWSLSVK